MTTSSVSADAQPAKSAKNLETTKREQGGDGQTCSVQEVIGEPTMTTRETERKWQERERPAASSSTATTTAKTPSTTRSSASSSKAKTSSTSMKKRIDKGRQLQRRHSDGEAPGRRCLTQELQDVADNMDDDDDDPELISDQEHEGGIREDAGATPRPQPPQPPPLETQATDFWARLDGVLENQINRVGTEMVVAMNALKNRFGAEIKIEREERKQEAAKVNEKIQMLTERIKTAENQDALKLITDRLVRLENADMTKPTAHSKNNKENEAPTGWVPTHMIIGGWEPETDRETIEHECEHMKIPQIANDCQQGQAPRTYGYIAEARGATGRFEQVVRITKLGIQQQGGMVGDKKRWATMDEAAKDEAAKARKVMPNCTEIDDSADHRDMYANTAHIS